MMLFAVSAMLVAVMGIYGVVAYSVNAAVMRSASESRSAANDRG